MQAGVIFSFFTWRIMSLIGLEMHDQIFTIILIPDYFIGDKTSTKMFYVGGVCREYQPPVSEDNQPHCICCLNISSHDCSRSIMSELLTQLVLVKTCCPILDIIIILGIFSPLPEVFWCLEEVIPELLSALLQVTGSYSAPPHHGLLLSSSYTRPGYPPHHTSQ